ncbi:MAG: endolytic transglycosylase MltG [Ruminococcus sp.]|nr:endolytic transglycosylase MltG [Ruminococcus sp.]
MSENTDKRDSMSQEEVERYRRQRVEQFRLRIEDEAEKPKAEPVSDFTDEITSFSDETTKAQIERASKKELRRQKKEEKKVQRIKAGRNKKVFRIAWIVMVIVLSVVISHFLVSGSNDFLAIKRTDETLATIRIEAGDTPARIGEKLADKGVIDSKAFFTLFANITGKVDDVEPGVYHIPCNKDYLGILNHLQFTGNRQTTITLQITEGTNVQELADILYEAGVTYDKEEFLRLCNSDEFDEEFYFIDAIEDDPKRVYKLEGYLFPDTYEFYVDEAPDITIRRFLNNFEARFFEDEYQVDGYETTMTINGLIHDEGKYTIDEYVNIASIVLGESANEEDMYNVSSVIHNRLDFGAEYDIHSLGMDSTAFYPYKNIDAVPKDIRDTFVSDYDTYNNEGLPPSAICSPSAEALIATLVPADTNYLYFCHSASGDAYYAETYGEHLTNLSKAGLN